MKIEIEKLIYGGFGLGRDESGRPIFVRKAVPGDRLEVEIIKDKKNYAEAIIRKIIEPSSRRIKPQCPNFDLCGGCDHQNIGYDDQLAFKGEIFQETLRRAGVETEILPIIPGSDSEFYYRNTIRFFFLQRDNKISLAMHHFAKPDKLIEIGECSLQSEWSTNFATELSNFINKSIDDSSPFFQLRIREGKFTGDRMVEIITKTGYLPEKQKLIWFLKNFPGIKSAYHTVPTRDNLIDAKRSLLFGSTIIYEKIGKYTFQISPESFFQTNSMGIKTLYDKIKEFANVGIGESVLDLYCGTGTIGLYLSTLAKRMVGVESVQSAVNDANANAKINKIHNAEFICADAVKWLSSYTPPNLPSERGGAIILDPPREGLNKEIIERLLTFDFRLLAYVSCNPSTFARDIKEFEKNGLKLKKVQPVDMFPQTQHIECVGVISR